MSSKVESRIQSAEQEWLSHWKQGPPLRWTRIPLPVGDTAVDFELEDVTGLELSVRRLESDRANGRLSAATRRQQKGMGGTV